MNFKWAIEARLPGFDRYFEAGPTNLSKIIKKPKVERRVEGPNRKIHAADFPFFPRCPAIWLLGRDSECNYRYDVE